MVCKIELLSLYLEYLRSTGIFDTIRFGADIERAIEFIHNNYKRNFSAKEIAEYCNISCSYLRASFKSKIGMTIIDYRDKLRFTLAKEMLSNGQFTIKETAEELGFCDVYYFSKFFARHSGTTPAKFAKKHECIDFSSLLM